MLLARLNIAQVPEHELLGVSVGEHRAVTEVFDALHKVLEIEVPVQV
jgi:hypothetical protein